MKKIILCLLALALLHQSFAQTTILSEREILWQKSKHQRTAAWVLLGGGAALFLTGAIIGGNKASKDLGNAFATVLTLGNYQAPPQDYTASTVLIVAGGVCVAGSIPFFILSGQNRRLVIRAMSFQQPRINANQWTFRRASGIEVKFTQTLF